jgi:hypothetical protein
MAVRLRIQIVSASLATGVAVAVALPMLGAQDAQQLRMGRASDGREVQLVEHGLEGGKDSSVIHSGDPALQTVESQRATPPETAGESGQIDFRFVATFLMGAACGAALSIVVALMLAAARRRDEGWR